MTEKKQHIRYPKIKILGDVENAGIFGGGKVYITEKVDGANFQFQRYKDQIVMGSRNQRIFMSGVNVGTDASNFIAIKYLLDNIDIEKVNPDYVYYGESMQHHHVKYSNVPSLLGFDILDLKAGKFLDWKEAETEFNRLGIPPIKLIESTNMINLADLNELVKQPSAYGGHREGIAIKNYTKLNRYGRPLFAKIVSHGFKETMHVKSKPKKSKDASVDMLRLIDTYCTPARMRKVLLKMDVEPQMSIMPDFFKLVGHDILNEEIVNISEDFNGIDFKVFYMLVGKDCAHFLKQYLMEKAT